jgi:hypothetical protein
MVGINDYAERPLKGCVNDTILMRDFLKTQRGVPDDQLRLYANAESTRAAIIDGLAWLAQPDADETADAPSLRIFHYAGHGIQQADQNGDEPDGSDECLMPIDYATAGVITDDVLSELYSQFAPTTQLVLLIDSCHSGTIHKGFGEDIRYRTMPIAPPEYKKIVAAKTAYQKQQLHHVVGKIQAIDTREATAEELEKTAQELIAAVQKQSFGKPQSHENVILLAACKPEQTAADANFGGTYHGAMTFFLNLALQGNTGITYADLAEQLRREMYDNKFAQVPQLEGDPEQIKRPFLG